MFVQVILFLRGTWRKDDWKWIVWCIIISLAGFIPGKNEHAYDLMHVIITFAVFIFAFAILFKERLLPIINEHVLLVWNLLFLSVYLPDVLEKNFAFWLVAAPSLFVLFLALTPWKPNKLLKFLFYVWFLVIVVAIGVAHFQMMPLFHSSASLSIGGLIAELFFGGMSSLWIGVYIVYLFILLPIPSKSQSIRDRIQTWKEDVHLMISRYSDHQLRIPMTISIVLIIGGVLLANHHWKFLSPFLLVNIIITLVPGFLGLLHWMFGEKGMRQNGRRRP